MDSSNRRRSPVALDSSKLIKEIQELKVDLYELKKVLAMLEQQQAGSSQTLTKVEEAKVANEDDESQKSDESDGDDASSQGRSVGFSETSESDLHELFAAKLAKSNLQLMKPLSDRNINLIKSVQRFLKSDIQYSFVQGIYDSDFVLFMQDVVEATNAALQEKIYQI